MIASKKMRKIIALVIAALLFSVLIPERAKAAGNTIDFSEDGVLSLEEFATADKDVINIYGDAAVTLTGKAGKVYKNVEIICYGSCKVILKNVSIVNEQTYSGALRFPGGAINVLFIYGGCKLQSGYGYAGVRVMESSSLIIRGSGTLEAVGGNMAAGIGSCQYQNSGTITIVESVKIHAVGGKYAAAIGGGYNGKGGSVYIESDGEVIADGWACGIGPGQTQNFAEVIIRKGYIYATSSNGQGIYADIDYGGSLTLAGGVVIAKGNEGHDDIYLGYNAQPFKMTGNSVLIYHSSDNDIRPAPGVRYLSRCYVKNGYIFGIKAPDGLDYAVCYYPEDAKLISYYDLATAPGNEPEVTYSLQLPGQSTMVGENIVFTKPGYRYGGWNTEGAGNGTRYSTGDAVSFKSDTSLYIMWEEIRVESVALNTQSLQIERGKTKYLSSAVLPVGALRPEVTWESSDPEVAAVGPDGAVSALSVGNAVITASADGKSAQCAVEVWESSITQEFDLTLLVGYEAALYAIADPAGRYLDDAYWESSHPKVVSVNQKGLATAISTGTAVVTARLDGDRKCTINITVLTPDDYQNPRDTPGPTPNRVIPSSPE